MAGAAVGLAAAPHIAVARPVLWHRPPHGSCNSPLLPEYILSPSHEVRSQATCSAPGTCLLGQVHYSERCYCDTCKSEPPVHVVRLSKAFARHSASFTEASLHCCPLQSCCSDVLAETALNTCTVPPPIACLALGTGRSSGPPAGAPCSGVGMLLRASAGCGAAAMTANAVADLWLAAGARAACRSCTACKEAPVACNQCYASSRHLVPACCVSKPLKTLRTFCKGKRLAALLDHIPEL